MLNKKLMILAIIIVSLLAVSAVNAVDNVTDDITSIDDDEIMQFNENECYLSVFENQDAIIDSSVKDTLSTNNQNDEIYLEMENRDNDNLISRSISENNNLSSGMYLDKGPLGYIESNDAIISYKNPIGYKIQLIGSDVQNKEIQFDIYDSDKEGIHVGYFYSITDQNGYATLNANLMVGHYWMKISSDSFKHGSVWNALTVKPVGYKGVKIKSSSKQYGKNNYVRYSWSGIFKGYLKVYKGNKLVKKIKLKSNSKKEDNEGFKWLFKGKYNTKKLKIGKYTAKIVDSKGKIVAKTKFKILKKSKKTAKKKSKNKKHKIIKKKTKKNKYIIKIGKYKGKVSKSNYKALKRAKKYGYQCVVPLKSINNKYFMSLEYYPYSKSYEGNIYNLKKGFYGNVWGKYTYVNVVTDKYLGKTI